MTQPARIERITRSLAYMLRHQPEQFDLDLDPYGYGDLDEVVRALNERLGEPVEVEDVEEAVESGDRQRYEIVDSKIRALYGHSIAVEPGEPTKPPELLYIGLSARDADRAGQYGLRGGRRSFLHLALTEDDAAEAGRRLAREYAVVTVHALDAWEEGINFFDRKALFLSEPIPTRYIEVGEVYDDGEEPAPRGGRGNGRERSRPPRGRGRGRRDRDDDDRDEEREDRDDRGRREERGRRDDREERGGRRDDREERGGRGRREERGEREERGGRGRRDDREERGERRGGRDRDREDRPRRERGERGDRGDRGERRGGRDREERAPRERTERPAPRAAESSSGGGGGFGSGVFEESKPERKKPEARPPAPKQEKAAPEPAPAPKPAEPEGPAFGAGL